MEVRGRNGMNFNLYDALGPLHVPGSYSEQPREPPCNMASSADVRDILALPAAGSSNTVPAAKKLVSSAPKKPDGISREVYALIGDNSPTLVQTYAAPKLKQKPTFGKTQTAKPKEEKPPAKW